MLKGRNPGDPSPVSEPAQALSMWPPSGSRGIYFESSQAAEDVDVVSEPVHHQDDRVIAKLDAILGNDQLTSILLLRSLICSNSPVFFVSALLVTAPTTGHKRTMISYYTMSGSCLVQPPRH